MYVRKDSAAPAHARTRAHRPAAPHQSSGVSQTPHPTACPQAGIPHTDHHSSPSLCDRPRGGGGRGAVTVRVTVPESAVVGQLTKVSGGSYF